MRKSRRALLLPLLAAALALALAGCAAEKSTGPGQGEGDPEQPGLTLPSPGDPEYCAYILVPGFWGQGVILEGNLEMGYLMVGFNVPAGTSLYAPFDGITGDVSLEDYSTEKSESYEGLSLYATDSLNGFSAYNITGTTEGPIKTGDAFAKVVSDQFIFPKIYGKVNLIIEFNLFDIDAGDYEEMKDIFNKIFEHLLENQEVKP